MTLDTQPYDLERLDPDCMDPLVAAETLRDAPWQRLVVLGDSLAAGVREPLAGYRDAGFADRLGATLASTRPGFVYRNLGARNLKIAEIHETQLPQALALEPDLAIVIAGGNDALRSRFDPDTVRARLLSLAEPLAQRGTYIVSIGLFDLPRTGLLPPEVAGPMAERLDLFDKIAADVTASLGGLHVDTHHHPRGSDPAIYSSDRIHCNARGHAIAYAAIVDALASVSAGPP